MKRGLRDISFAILGFMIAFAVQEYAIQRHERIKKAEKEVLKQGIERENQILIRRLEEDFEAFKDSVTAVFVKKKKEYIKEHGLSSPGSSGLKWAMETKFDAERDGIVAKKRKEINRKIEDLEMRLDF